MNEVIDKFRVQLGAAIDSVEFVKKALDRRVPEPTEKATDSVSWLTTIVPYRSTGRAEPRAGLSDDDRLIDVATERGRTLVRDLACELVGIRICQRIDISYVADPSWAEPGD